MAAHIDIPLRRNEDWVRRWQCSDAGKAPIDLTGWTIALHVRARTNNSVLIAAATIGADELATGVFTTSLSATEGTPLNGYGSPLQTENLPYDLRLTDPGGMKIVIAAGTVVLSRGVSHD